eukprot:gene20693-biopygen13122
MQKKERAPPQANGPHSGSRGRSPAEGQQPLREKTAHHGTPKMCVLGNADLGGSGRRPGGDQGAPRRTRFFSSPSLTAIRYADRLLGE